VVPAPRWLCFCVKCVPPFTLAVVSPGCPFLLPSPSFLQNESSDFLRPSPSWRQRWALERPGLCLRRAQCSLLLDPLFVLLALFLLFCFGSLAPVPEMIFDYSRPLPLCIPHSLVSIKIRTLKLFLLRAFFLCHSSLPVLLDLMMRDFSFLVLRVYVSLCPLGSTCIFVQILGPPPRSNYGFVVRTSSPSFFLRFTSLRSHV